MIVGRLGVRLLTYRVSNIRPTAFEASLKNIKSIHVAPVTLHDRPTKQTLFKTAEEQQLPKTNSVTQKKEEVQKEAVANTEVKKQEIVVEKIVKEPSFFDKIGNVFASKSDVQQPHSAEEVIAKVHQLTKERRIKSGQAPIITRVKAEQSSDLRILHEKNIGLNLFLNRVYLTTGSSILMSLATVHFASSIPYMVMNPFMCIGYGTIMTLVGMFGAYHIKPHVIVQQEEGYQHIKTRNGILRSSLFVMGWVGVGLFSMPFANMLSSLLPMLVTNLIGMTIGCFGGASIFISSMPRLPLFSYGGLIGGLIGSVLSMKLINAFNEMVYGAHFVSNFMQALDMYGGTMIFSFFILYNTIKAKQAYKEGNSDHYEISIKFYIDILLFFQKAFNFIFKKKID